MIRPGTVLLLGAGSSYHYGFPLGSGLREQVIGASEIPPLTEALGVQQEHARVFRDRFFKARPLSIDNFLAKQPQFMDLGKKLIAHCLLSAEKNCRDRLLLPSFDSKVRRSDPYAYLWGQIAQQGFDELDLSRLKIVTFNYDRSLQVFLLQAMCATYGVTESVAREKLHELETVHVYGSLGSVFESETDTFVPFGVDPNGQVRPDLINRAADQIHLIPEARDDSASILRARTVLQAANHLCILGFGFDELNLRRLDAIASLGSPIKASTGALAHREVYASALGLPRKAVEALATTLGKHHSIPIANFIDGDCDHVLKESLVLGEWSAGSTAWASTGNQGAVVSPASLRSAP